MKIRSNLAVFGLLAVLQGLASTLAGAENLPVPRERFGDLAKAEEPSFRRHVIPLMSRAGCNGRECHGAFSGQGGFQLSLFGYDFEHDHKEITADSEDGVRIEPRDPLRSLVLLKSTNQEKHKGKERLKKDSWEYNLPSGSLPAISKVARSARTPRSAERSKVATATR